jgi:hypothetical protein
MDLLRLYLLAAALSSSDYYYYVQLCTVYKKRGEKTLAGFSLFSCTVLCNSIIIRERQSPVSENVHHRFFFSFISDTVPGLPFWFHLIESERKNRVYYRIVY